MARTGKRAAADTRSGLGADPPKYRSIPLRQTPKLLISAGATRPGSQTSMQAPSASLSTCLRFEEGAEAAARLCCSLPPGSSVTAPPDR